MTLEGNGCILLVDVSNDVNVKRTEDKMTKTKKIAAGEYETTINGREYQISYNDLMGRWNAVAVEGLTTTWINDTATKRDAIALCEEHATN